jgi:RimJ/RimL family protein N-acetyltransferase
MTLVKLRPVEEEDVRIFYEDQADREGAAMAAVPSRSRGEHEAHWKKILADKTNVLRTIVEEGHVVGNVVSWIHDDRRAVGYWISKDHWGKGIATQALREFVDELKERPLYAFVALHNLGSIRVLEKCGFRVVDEPGPGLGDDIPEQVMALVD